MIVRRGHQLLLTVCFLTMIGSVGIVQTVIELTGGESVQFLDLFRQAPTASHLRLFEKDLEKASWFARTLRPPAQFAHLVAMKDAGEKVVTGRDGWWFYRPGVRYLIEPLPAASKDDTARHEVVSAIVSFRDQLEARGIRLLVVPIPGKASVYPDRLTSRVYGPLTHTNTSLVISDLTDAGLEVVNLQPVFAQARTSQAGLRSADLYLARDTHWTPAGLQLAATAVAERLRELGWAAAGDDRYDIEPIVVHRPGDLLEMLQAPQVERFVTPEEVTCDQVIDRTTAEPYRDDPDAPILVLGDSFLRIYERDEPGAAGFIAHLARELGRPLASVVNDGGASTLVRQELARKPHLLNGKKVVVWEFVERDIRFGLEGWQHVPLPESAGPS